VAAYMDEMAKMHPDLVFYSPSDDASDSVSETSGYIGTVLSVFSAIALAMSSLLFSIVMVITIGENDKEAKLLHALGVSSDDVARIYRAVAFHYALQSFLAAGVALLLCELVAKKFIADAFGVAYSLQISWTPFASVGGFVIVFLVVMSIYIRKKSKKSF
jgi:predicted lysophospholipase L1 biosynthesis ABC-type transport system permease subunit